MQRDKENTSRRKIKKETRTSGSFTGKIYFAKELYYGFKERCWRESLNTACIRIATAKRMIFLSRRTCNLWFFSPNRLFATGMIPLVVPI